MSGVDFEAFHEDIQTAIAEVVTRHGGGVMLRWLLCLETMAPQDDQPGLWVLPRKGMAQWEVLGLADFVRGRELTGMVNDCRDDPHDHR